MQERMCKAKLKLENSTWKEKNELQGSRRRKAKKKYQERMYKRQNHVFLSLT